MRLCHIFVSGYVPVLVEHEGVAGHLEAMAKVKDLLASPGAVRAPEFGGSYSDEITLGERENVPVLSRETLGELDRKISELQADRDSEDWLNSITGRHPWMAPAPTKKIYTKKED